LPPPRRICSTIDLISDFEKLLISNLYLKISTIKIMVIYLHSRTTSCR
jgi:hypothetical protein